MPELGQRKGAQADCPIIDEDLDNLRQYCVRWFALGDTRSRVRVRMLDAAHAWWLLVCLTSSPVPRTMICVGRSYFGISFPQPPALCTEAFVAAAASVPRPGMTLHNLGLEFSPFLTGGRRFADLETLC